MFLPKYLVLKIPGQENIFDFSEDDVQKIREKDHQKVYYDNTGGTRKEENKFFVQCC